jgi:STE24 endopeptidase
LLILAKWAAQLWLERLNSRHVLANASAVPDAFKGVVDEATYTKSVQYTLAKGRLDQIQVTYNSAVLLVVLSAGCCRGDSMLSRKGLEVRRGPWPPSSSPRE